MEQAAGSAGAALAALGDKRRAAIAAGLLDSMLDQVLVHGLFHPDLRLNIRLFADDRDRRLVTGLLHRVLLTVIGTAAGLMAVLLLGTPGGPRITAGVGLFPLLGYALLIVAVVLVLRVLVVVFRRE